MRFGTVGCFLRDGDWIIEGERKTNDIGKLELIKGQQNSLIRAIDSCHVAAVPYQSPNELVSPDSF
jgi:hypothetical protein